MQHSQREEYSAIGAELDVSLSQPTATLMVESLSRFKVAAPASVSPGPLAHLFPAPILDHTGPYRLVCEIASGGMATVHLALNRGVAGFEKFVAVKRIHPHLAQDKEFYEMFIDEARIAAQVNHPYVCNVFDFGCADEGYYIAMEFLHGEPLSKVLACAGERNLHQPCFPHIAARIIANLAEGLHAAHSLCDENGNCLDIIHRDVTPQNLFVLYDGTVRVTDFGIARARTRLAETHGGRLKGTLSYMAPEQLKRADTDSGVDIWALGVVLWEMLTARKLFRSSSDGETVMDVLSRPIVAPSRFNPHVSRELDTIVLRAVSRHRSERYAAAGDFSRALERYLTHSGDSVLASDVAAWLSELFPTGQERGRELLSLARAAAEELPRFSLSERPAPAAPARESFASLPAIAIDEPCHVSSPGTAVAPRAVPSNHLHPRLSDRIIAVGLTGSMALVGLGVLGSLFRNLPSAATRGPAPVAALNSLMPSVWSSARAKAHPAPLLGAANSAPEPAIEHGRGQAPRKLAASRAKVAAVAKPAPPASAASPSVQPGSVLVSTPGLNADVFEAGRSLGQTPKQIELSPGPHTLLLKTEFGARAVVVNVKPGSAAVLSLVLADTSKDKFVSGDRRKVSP